jgi:hypothetical protein
MSDLAQSVADKISAVLLIVGDENLHGRFWRKPPAGYPNTTAYLIKLKPT